MKINANMVNTQFERFLEYNGLHESMYHDDVGGYALDYQREYGGYIIECVINPQGAVSYPFGRERRNAKEMYDVLQFWNTVELLRTTKQLQGTETEQ